MAELPSKEDEEQVVTSACRPAIRLSRPAWRILLYRSSPLHLYTPIGYYAYLEINHFTFFYWIIIERLSTRLKINLRAKIVKITRETVVKWKRGKKKRPSHTNFIIETRNKEGGQKKDGEEDEGRPVFHRPTLRPHASLSRSSQLLNQLLQGFVFPSLHHGKKKKMIRLFIFTTGRKKTI